MYFAGRKLLSPVTGLWSVLIVNPDTGTASILLAMSACAKNGLGTERFDRRYPSLRKALFPEYSFFYPIHFSRGRSLPAGMPALQSGGELLS
jgi:hypothetical protein